MKFEFDVIVVGGGHAGCEAAYISAVMGCKTLLITMDLTKLAQMSCNPAMGGIAKGQIIREVDALGGMSGIVTDKTMVQFRMLNSSKGPAMWSPRAQCDRLQFSLEWRKVLENTDNLYLWQDEVDKLLIDGNSVYGVETVFGTKFLSKTVILTAGTFLNGVMYVGLNSFTGGRSGERSNSGLSRQLIDCGFEVDRLKTGTSARLDGRYINFKLMSEQTGDNNGCFSCLYKEYAIKNPMSCFITNTGKKTHEILKKGFEQSPLFQHRIKGLGPRYCPSIETKIITFPDKDSHQLFIEPEGNNTNEYYINGFSSSLPLEIQFEALRSIAGLENISIFRPGYAIEYDFFQPTQLKKSLETKNVDNLFFAGQINGTTGYEEAAAQGIMAGINASLRIRGEEPLVLTRDESYIGVLIDDLVTKGVDEPYRMFTSRAEYRILLRQDNADERLTPIGERIHSVSTERIDNLKKKDRAVSEIVDYIRETGITPDAINGFLSDHHTSPIQQRTKLLNIALRPQVSLYDLLVFLSGNRLFDFPFPLDSYYVNSAEILVKYEGYIRREKIIADKIKRLESLKISKDINYSELLSISTEGRQKLNAIRPNNIGEASRIPGVSPSDINVLLMYLGR